MILTIVEDVGKHKLIGFYCFFTSISMGLILTALYSTSAFYLIGKYSFFPVIALLLFMEVVKYFMGNFYFSRDTQPIIGRAEQPHKKNYVKNKIKEALRCLGLFSCMLMVYYTFAVLFGAQLFTKQEETFMLSLLLCSLTIFPSCLHVSSYSVLYLLFGMKSSNDLLNVYLLKCIQLTVFGCWLGAFVIPLDWDRPWQDWPISCGIGALVGYVAANIFIMGLIVYVRRTLPVPTPGRKVR